MLTWFKDFLYDKQFFLGTIRALMFGLGGLVQMGIIPTGVNGLGPKLGLFISALSLLIVGGGANSKV